MPEVMFNGSAGRIEGRYQHSKDTNAPIALMLHPHPLQGGTMNNRVVYAMFQVFSRLGFSVLRFNFRGVGRSQGSFDRGEGELSDAAAALDWLQKSNPNAGQCWIAGFSFGAWIGMQLLMRRPEIAGFISAAPPAGSHDFTFLAPCPASGLIVNGRNDDVVPPEAITKLANKLSQQQDITIDHRVIDNCNHLFQDKLEEFQEIVEGYLREAMTREVESEDA